MTKKTLKVSFEDVHAYSGNTYYLVPNEEPLIFPEILRDTVPIHRAAGICSAGEVGFFGLLPLVQEDLVLVDHSYTSLTIAMIKYLTLQKYGPEKTISLLTGADGVALTENLEELKKYLPFELTAHSKHYGLTSLGYPSSLISQMWRTFPLEVVKAAAKKLDRVSFIHGDLSDLADRGPFDLLYISNALEHSSRTGRAPTLNLLERAVRPGGLIIGTRHTAAAARWEVVETRTGRSWTYQLFRTPEKKAA